MHIAHQNIFAKADADKEEPIENVYEYEKSWVPWFNLVDTASNHLDKFGLLTFDSSIMLYFPLE